MILMLATRDVSVKLSGWLNASAICRVAKGRAWRICGMRGRGEAGRVRGAAAAAQAACREGVSCGGSLAKGGHARSARKTCPPCL